MSLELERSNVGLAIPAEIVEATHMSVTELKQEIAIMLYQKEKLTLGQAGKLADMSRFKFQHLLAARGIRLNFGAEDFQGDLRALKELEDL